MYAAGAKRTAVFVEFLVRLLEQGSVVLAGRPILTDADRPAATAALASAFRQHALDVAGPPIAFDPATALSATEFIANSCWFLLSRGEPDVEVRNALRFPAPADSASAHLSADVVLRFLPALYRRSRALAADDTLTESLARALREWPLAGALGDVLEAPLTAPKFGGHSGLLLLYAERLASRPKPEWVLGGSALPYIELTFSERAIPVPTPAGGGVTVER